VASENEESVIRFFECQSPTLSEGQGGFSVVHKCATLHLNHLQAWENGLLMQT
jgi:hypothetical protein